MMDSRALCAVSLAMAICAGSAGCRRPSLHEELLTAERFDAGVTLILPGIEGAGRFSNAVQEGLVEAGVPFALPVYSWGRTIPLAGPLLNQVDTERAKRAGKTIAAAIEHYCRKHPGRPVHLIGHSGGGAVAVFALESLAPGVSVEGAILLSPSLSANYDLRGALAHTRKGIANFWSPNDVALLVVGTTVFGTIDGVHAPAAGARGFRHGRGDGAPYAKLHQTGWKPSMVAAGNFGGHLGTTNRSFVSEWVAQWVLADAWPPSLLTIAALADP